MGWLTSPHQTFASLEGSRTMNLSFGERPVWVPVLTTSGPSAAIIPSPSRTAASYKAAVDRLATILPALMRVPARGARVLGGSVEGWTAVMTASVSCSGVPASVPGAVLRSDRPRVTSGEPDGSRLPQSWLARILAPDL